MRATFRSLQNPNDRIWAAGALVSNIGSWMQRTAQDWIVLTELTDHDAAAVGITVALQMAPIVLLVPVAGWIADRFDRRTGCRQPKLCVAGRASGHLCRIGQGDQSRLTRTTGC